MSWSKPGSLAFFQSGKHISTVMNFVSTMNWLISWVSNFKCGKGLKIEGADSGVPKLKFDEKNLIFKSGDDTNLVFEKEVDEDGNVTVKVNLFYK